MRKGPRKVVTPAPGIHRHTKTVDRSGAHLSARLGLKAATSAWMSVRPTLTEPCAESKGPHTQPGEPGTVRGLSQAWWAVK